MTKLKDPTVPARAAFIIDQIYTLESGKTRYQTISGFKQDKLKTPITKWTIGELLADMGNWRKRYGTLSSAAGAPQIIKATLEGLVSELGLSKNQKYDEKLQDRLCYHLLRRRGYDAWVAGKIDDAEFAGRLAREWASLPVLKQTKGAHRQVSRGQSYYSGDGLNATKYPAASFERLLADARNLPAHVDTPEKPVTGKVVGGVVVGGAVGAGAVEQSDNIIAVAQSSIDLVQQGIGVVTAGAAVVARLGAYVPEWALYGGAAILAAGVAYNLWSKRKG